MSDIIESLNEIKKEKEILRSVLVEKWGSIDTGNTLESYVAAVSALPSPEGVYPSDWVVLDEVPAEDEGHAIYFLVSMLYPTQKIQIPMYGARNYSIDWGDGTIEKCSENGNKYTLIDHVYGLDFVNNLPKTRLGYYQLVIKMRDETDEKPMEFAMNLNSGASYGSSVLAVKNASGKAFNNTTMQSLELQGTFASYAGMFSDNAGLLIPPSELPDVLDRTNASYMFFNCANLKTGPEMDFVGVENASAFLTACKNITWLPTYDFSTVTNARSAFSSMSKLRRIKIDNAENLTDCSGMFAQSNALEFVDITFGENVTNISNLFSHCTVLVDACSNYVATPALTNIAYGFWQSPKMKHFPDFTNAGLQGGNQYTFYGCTGMDEMIKIGFIEGLTSVDGMFINCSIPLVEEGQFVLPESLTDIQSAFSGNRELVRFEQPLLLPNVMFWKSVFKDCSKLEYVAQMDVSGVDTRYDGAYMARIFQSCVVLKDVSFVENCIPTNINFAESPLLSSESLDSIIAGLDNTTTGFSLTLHPDVVISEAQILEITNRNWTLVQ